MTVRNRLVDLLQCFAIGVFLLCWIPLVLAVDSIELSVSRITVDDWSLQTVLLRLADIQYPASQWKLQSASLTLPPPFNELSAFRISCGEFQWRDRYMQCVKGQGQLDYPRLNSPTFNFSFKVQDQQGTLHIDNLRLFGGAMSIRVREHSGLWRAEVVANGLTLATLQSFFQFQQLENLQAKLNLELTLEGKRDRLQTVIAKAFFKQMTLQAVDGKLASEAMDLQTTWTAKVKNKIWQWQNSNWFMQGALYLEPVYLETQRDLAVSLSTEGEWNPKKQRVNIRSATLNYPGQGKVTGSVEIDLHQDFNLRKAILTAKIEDLDTAVPIFLTPFLEGGPYADIGLTGAMDLQLSLTQNEITAFQADLRELTLNDPQERFHIEKANGQINWQAVGQTEQPSKLDWQQMKVKAVPFDSGQLHFFTYGKHFSLTQRTDLPLLDGMLSIDRFSLDASQKDNTDVLFSGSVANLSLEQLSEALQWTPLSGEISGTIPSVSYKNDKLVLDGALQMHVFDGDVTISNLASSGMFTDFAQFYADIDIDDLDLNTLTRKFQFGFIEGRLSGFIHNLYLENWQPVSFYAWLGTPDDDDSRHRISQKAVENIASIGGGGAADAISRGFLSLFDSFGYDKLGFGCYLHGGVCQMMGVAAADNGYYLVKGGGLPRIDVIGYNSRLDWNVLLQRLRRVTAADEVVIE